MTGIKFASPEFDVRFDFIAPARSSNLTTVKAVRLHSWQGGKIRARHDGKRCLHPEDQVMNLPQRPLGSSRVVITRTGFGASAIGGGGWAFGWGSQDTFSREHVARFAEDDCRRRSPHFNRPNLSRNLALRPIAQRDRATVSAVAVAWTLARPGVTGAIVGGRSPQQVDRWIGAASLQLTAADLQEISDPIVRYRRRRGPTIPQLERAVAGHEFAATRVKHDRRINSKCLQPEYGLVLTSVVRRLSFIS
jgi:hypothetical protein